MLWTNYASKVIESLFTVVAGYAHCDRTGVYSVVQKSVQDWAYTIYNWIITNGYGMEVMDLEDIRSGDRVCHECMSYLLLSL